MTDGPSFIPPEEDLRDLADRLQIDPERLLFAFGFYAGYLIKCGLLPVPGFESEKEGGR